MSTTTPSPDIAIPDKRFKYLDPAINYFERLGVCVAVAAGGSALIYYQEKVLSWWPTGAEIVGVMLLIAAFVLWGYVSWEFVEKLVAGNTNRWTKMLVTFFFGIIGFFFFLAGIHLFLTQLPGVTS